MKETTYINAKLPNVPTSFENLRKEGIELLQKIAGTVWTDYNIHDPGVTILEHTCLALTDLNYRIGYEMKDLLRRSEGNSFSELYRPSEVLTSSPVTFNDLRKLLIDQDGVMNAWIEQVSDEQNSIYLKESQDELTLDPEEGIERIPIKGAYRVLIERDQLSSIVGNTISRNVTQLLEEHRNIGEQAVEVAILPSQRIFINADIEIDDSDDLNLLKATIYFAISNYISPRIKFHNLQSMLDKGYRTDEVFEGPRLKHGFILEEELELFQRKSDLRVSDLVNLIMDIKGVRAIKQIIIGTGSTQKDWVLELNSGSAPVFDVSASTISLSRHGLPEIIEEEKVRQYQNQINQKNIKKELVDEEKDVILEESTDRELGNYHSFQNQFRELYGVGDKGLPKTAGKERLNQSRQLRAYLLFFDQIIGNYFEQIEEMKNVFSFNSSSNQTYFSKSLIDVVPGVNEIIIDKDDYVQQLETSIESATEQFDRKLTVLNHLLARFSEDFSNYTLAYHLQNQDPLEVRSLMLKQRKEYLKNYPSLSSKKQIGRLINSNYWNLSNLSGIEKRIYQKLNIELISNKSLIAQEGIHLIEHMLFRPSNESSGIEFVQNLVTSSIQFIESNSDGHYTVESAFHNFNPGEQIVLSAANEFNGVYEVLNVSEGKLIIANVDIGLRTSLVFEAVSGNVIRQLHRIDPFSLQVSVVVPRETGRCENSNFRKLMELLIRAEIPAHLACYVHWLSVEQMRSFETELTSFYSQD